MASTQISSCSTDIEEIFSTPPPLGIDILSTIIRFSVGDCEALFRSCKAANLVSRDPHALALWLVNTYGTHRALVRLPRVPAVRSWPIFKLTALLRVLFRHNCSFPSDIARLSLISWVALQAGGEEVSAGNGTFLDLLLTLLHDQTDGKEAIATTLKSTGPIFLEACTKGRLGSVKVLLKLVPSLADFTIDSALNATAAAGHAHVMAVLLEAGFSAQAKKSEALSLAVGNGHLDATHLLLKWGADATSRPNLLQLAVQCLRDLPSSSEPSSGPMDSLVATRVGLIKLLVEWGARDDQGKALCAAAALGDVPCLTTLLPLQMQGHPYDHGKGLAHLAQAPRRSIEVSGVLRDPLTLALEACLIQSHFDTATLLLEAGAPVDIGLLQARKRFLDERASTVHLGLYPSNLRGLAQPLIDDLLGQAAFDSDGALLNLLLKCGASPVVSDCQALRRAVLNGRVESVRDLLDAAGLHGLRRELPCCTLRGAVQRNYLEVASELLEATLGLPGHHHMMKHCCPDPSSCAARTMCFASSVEMVDLLVAHGGARHAREAMGLVASGKAQSWRNERVAQRMIDVLVEEEVARRLNEQMMQLRVRD